MNSCFSTTKKKIQILVFTLNLITFIIIISTTNNKKDNYIEYTNLSKYCSNLYIIVLFLILLIHSINQNLICSFISNNLSILTNDIGKIIINLLIGILFWSSNNNSHVIFGIINFVSSLALFLCELIFRCKIFKYINFDTQSSNGDKYSNQNSIDSNNIDNKNKKEEKNGSVLPLNTNQISDNGFENIKQENLKAQNPTL